MHAVGIIKKVDKLGRMVIPIELRSSLGLDEEDSRVEIFTDPKKEALIIKKYERGCDFCGEINDNVEYNGKKICQSCVEELSDRLEGKEELF